MRQTAAWIACACAVSLGAAACEGTTDRDMDRTAVDQPGEPGMADDAVGTAGEATEHGTVTVAAIMESPDQYIGKTVTVVADVEEVHGPNAFALDEDAPMAGGIDNDLLVFSRKAGTLGELDDQWLDNKVRVTGTVGKMTAVEIEREVGWDLDTEIEAEVEKAEAVLIASSVERTDR